MYDKLYNLKGKIGERISPDLECAIGLLTLYSGVVYSYFQLIRPFFPQVFEPRIIVPYRIILPPVIGFLIGWSLYQHAIERKIKAIYEKRQKRN